MNDRTEFFFETRRWGTPEGFTVIEVELREAVSSVGGATVTLLGEAGAPPPFDALELLGELATLSFDAAGARAFHGVVVAARAEMREGISAYVLELAPRLWRASRSRRSRVYLDLSLADITRRVMQENGFGDDDWAWRCAAPTPLRPYVVQYEETDLDFLQRTLEREGVFYFITHDGGRDRVVFGDHNNAFTPLDDADGALSYAPHGSADGSPGVRAWTRVTTLQPRAVAVRDYQPASPRVVMNPRLAPVMPDRWTVAESGLQSFYGDHVSSPEDAARVARLRAELLQCGAERWEGRSHAASMRAGGAFTLRDHPDASFEQAYVVVRATHRYRLGRGFDVAADGVRYENVVEALAQAVPFRPARATPRPQMPPWIPAVIDSPANVAQVRDGDHTHLASPLDEKGRYFVVFPFDTVAAAGPPASCAIPLAQGFAGQGFGQHFPLHRGTHVLVGHIHGDPDRPVIVCALMDSVVTAVATGGMIRTRGGVTLDYEDHAAPWVAAPR
ncbi:MAG: type VI secretion system tip protein TssI/VgrG [Polyangiales bacterium]